MVELDLYQISLEFNHALQSEEQTFLTVLFGYLIAAYGIGAKLTWVQVITFNAVYLVVICGLLYNMSHYWLNIIAWSDKGQAAEFGEVVVDLTARAQATVLACASMVAGSQYFMWSIRNTEPE